MQKLITPYCADFGKPNIVIKHFPDTESYVLIPKIKSLKNKRVIIYHRLYPNPEKRIFELLLILSRLKKETEQIELFVPYLPYARQDKESRKGEAISADVLCGILESSGVKKLTTYDCHFLSRPGSFTRNGLKIENKSAGKQLVVYAKKYFKKNNKQEKFIVISPDQGASYFTENAQGFSLQKKRKLKKEHTSETGIHAAIHKMEGEVDVKGKNVCILDDIIAGGGTILRAIEHLRKRGAKKIITGAVHGVFVNKDVPKKILRKCEHLFVTDTILQDNKKAKILKLYNF